MKCLKIQIEEEIYEGKPTEIIRLLWEYSFDKQQFPDLERYIAWMAENFERMTDLKCELSGMDTAAQAEKLLLCLADIDALEVIENE